MKGAVVSKSRQAGPAIAALSLVPFVVPTYSGKIPKDYVDFCKAANPTACIYLPAGATLGVPPPPSLPAMTPGITWAMEDDSLITDKATCDLYGGVLDAGSSLLGSGKVDGCDFYYPVVQFTNLKLTALFHTSAACPPPAKYSVDATGISTSYPVASLPSLGLRMVMTGPTPATCVVRVWIEK